MMRSVRAGPCLRPESSRTALCPYHSPAPAQGSEILGWLVCLFFRASKDAITELTTGGTPPGLPPVEDLIFKGITTDFGVQ